MSYQEALRVLELEVADEVSVRRAYLRLVKIFKPEANPEGFRRLREAYELLRRGPPRWRPGRGAPKGPVLFLHAQPGVRRPTEQRRRPPADTSALLRLQQLLATDPHGATDEEFATLLASVPTAHRLVTAFTLLEKHAPRRAIQAFVSALGHGVPGDVDRVRALSTLANSVLEQLASADIHGAKSLLAAAGPWLDACPPKVTDPAGLRIVWTLASELASLPDSFPAKPLKRWAAEIRSGVPAALNDKGVPSRARQAVRDLAPLLSSMLDQARQARWKAPGRASASRKKSSAVWTGFVPMGALVLWAVVQQLPPLGSFLPSETKPLLTSNPNPLPPGADRAEQSARALCVQQPSRSVSLCVNAQALSTALSQGYCHPARQALRVLRNELVSSPSAPGERPGKEPTPQDLVALLADDVEQLCQNR